MPQSPFTDLASDKSCFLGLGEGGGVARGDSACLARSRPWVQPLTLGGRMECDLCTQEVVTRETGAQGHHWPPRELGGELEVRLDY